MNPHLLIITVGLFYILVFGGMAVIQREGISLQFTLEALAITLLIAGGGYLTGSAANPILFLVFLYVLTMRSRLLVDLANLLSNRGRQRDAISMLQLALRLFPDRAARLIVLVNMGIVQLRRQNPESAQALLESVLEEAREGGLSLKHEAACRYNLGLALLRQGKEAEAVRQFSETIRVFPGSPYGKAAEQALEQRRHRGRKTQDETKAE